MLFLGVGHDFRSLETALRGSFAWACSGKWSIPNDLLHDIRLGTRAVTTFGFLNFSHCGFCSFEVIIFTISVWNIVTSTFVEKARQEVFFGLTGSKQFDKFRGGNRPTFD